MNDRKTHARSNTALEQKTNELLRVLARGWSGQWAEFEQFSASYLTVKGEKIAKGIATGSDDRRAASEAIRAGY